MKNTIYLSIYIYSLQGTNWLILKCLENDKLNIFSKQLSYRCMGSQKVCSIIMGEEETKEVKRIKSMFWVEKYSR